MDSIFSKVATTVDLDAASASITTLRELVQRGELELITDKPGSAAQRASRLTHLTESLSSAVLRAQLQEKIASEDFSFFTSHRMRSWVDQCQKEIDQIRVVHLEVAIPFKDKDLDGFRQLLTEKIGCPVVLELEVDHTLIGGAIIQHGTFRMDASLRSRFERFGDSWHQATR